jgi:hypothetical protein
MQLLVLTGEATGLHDVPHYWTRLLGTKG